MRLADCYKPHFFGNNVWPVFRFPEPDTQMLNKLLWIKMIKQTISVFKNTFHAVQRILLFSEPNPSQYFAPPHTSAVFAVISHRAKDQGYSESESTIYLNSLLSWVEDCLLPFFSRSYPTQTTDVPLNGNVKTFAADQWRWWSEYFDWSCMSDVMGQTVSGSQEVNQMCTRRNRH